MKRLLSLGLILVLLITMFPATVANATCTLGSSDLLEFGDYLLEAGSESRWYDTVVADNGETGTEDDPIIIDTAEEFVALTKGAINDTAGKYYKVADGISSFDLSKGNLNYDGTLDENLAAITGSGKNHAGAGPGFQGTFDGNGVTVYGAWSNHNDEYIAKYAGLFTFTKGDVTIKNVNVKLSHFAAKSAVGGIVGYHKGDGTNTLTIENCSVTDTYLEIKETGWGHGVGGIIGLSENLDAFVDVHDTDGDGDTTEKIYINGKTIIKNCFVNLDEKYFISLFESTQTDNTLRGVHGGIAGFVSSNALSVSDCIAIGITPYATTSCTTHNDVQHSGIEYHFTNIYTDMPSGIVNIGGGYTNRNFADRVFTLTPAQMQGLSALENMKLDPSIWMVDDEGYPELRTAHKNVSYVTNYDGTHSEMCECGFGGAKYECTLIDGKCTICKPQAVCSGKKTIYWNGYIATGFADKSAGTKDDPVIIKTAAELAYLVTSKADVSTLADGSPKYFKISDDIGTIVLQDEYYANDIMKLASANEVKQYFQKNSWGFYSWPNKGWEQSSFCGYFDGNGVKIYGLYQQSNNNAGLFSSIDAGASIHNVAVMNSYFNTTATNYQIGAIAAVTNSPGYGIDASGVVWLDGCIVTNCYMRSSAASNQATRSGVLFGTANQDSIVVDNCLVYGNDAYYGESYQHKIPLMGDYSNSIKAPAIKPAELEVKIQENVESTGSDMYYNSIRNTIAMGTDMVNTRTGYGYRKNEPDCFENCYTDGITGTVDFTVGSWTYNDKQIKYTTLLTLKDENLGNAWVATATLPEHNAFHAFIAIDNGNGTHQLFCDCGAKSITTSHITGTPTIENSVDPTCTTQGSCELVYSCSVCNTEISRQKTTLDMIGHTFDDESDLDCDTCGHVRPAFTFGDVNDDQKINNKDYVVLMRYINGWNVTIVHDACDLNRDSSINNKDCAVLLQYLNGWYNCLHKYNAATCTEAKTCIDCGQKGGDPLGHDYVLGECSRCALYSENYCPKLYFTGDMSEITRENQTSKKIECNIGVQYRSKDQIVDRTAKIKIQGSSSTQWRKKNYTITFYEDDSYENKKGVDVGWGSQSKYCLKANWIDKTHSRNVVTAKLAGEMQEKYNLLTTAPNNGAIDGFPVEVYINGEFHGLYTMNIPKDEWQFNMDKKNPNHIVIGGGGWEDPVLFKEIPTDFGNENSWEVEVGPEDEVTLAKLQRLVDFVINSSDQDFKTKFGEYLNLDSTLNYYIMMNYAWMPDNTGKNMLLATYDGKVWYPSLYDLDTTWGAHWTGGYEYNYSNGVINGSNSVLWSRFEKHFKAEIAARYFELRSSVLDPEYIMKKFYDFHDTIPQEVLDRETEKWTRPNDPIPGFDLPQIQKYLDTVVPRLDNRFAAWYIE